MDLTKIKTYSLKDRPSKVGISDFSKEISAGETFRQFFDGLPQILAAKDLKEIVERVAVAHLNKKRIIFGFGGHLIKTGLSPIVVQLMERGIVNAIAMNGSCIIHDFEIAYAGKTSEEVGGVLSDGSFGMARETGDFLNDAINEGAKAGIGMGESIGKAILKYELPNAGLSILAQAVKRDIPVTVHVALGTDIIHMHSRLDPELYGKSSYLDFMKFTEVVSQLEGGLYFNIGSAVLLPEVFLKALTIARNLGHSVNNFTTATFDFIKQYRPTMNVCHRPTQNGGKGYYLIGHHEILVPLLAAAILERIPRSGRGMTNP